MIIKIVKFLIMLIMLAGGLATFAENITLSAGVSLNEQVPVSLMGGWRVASVIKETDSPSSFKKTGIDIWNLSKSGDVITLSNPFTGASASINVSYVDKNTVRFTKEGSYDKQNLTDSVEVTLYGDKFEGSNTLKLVNVETGLVKTATYVLRGEKISGTSILER